MVEKGKSEKSKSETFIQPEVSIGLVGHVDHGKTTLTQALTGKWTDTHSEELKRGITIRLGYADATFYRCGKCKDPKCYSPKETCTCKSKCGVLRRVSFIDAPGHESLMATMLSGSAIIDGALLIIAANEKCPQPQTKEHLMALEIAGIKNIVIVQNKIDLVSKEEALENYKQIKEFVKGTIAENSPVIPISAQHNINIDVLIRAIEEVIKTPKRDLKKDPLVYIARSFDINKPGTEIDKLVGGVIGGAILQGKLKINDEIEIRPGRKIEEKGAVFWKPIFTKIDSLKCGGVDVKEAIPGGTMGILTTLDPSIVKSDNLIGNVVGYKDKLPETLYELKLKVNLLERVVGSEKDLRVEPLKKGESLMLNVNSATSLGIVKKIGKDLIEVDLRLPLCAYKESKVTISRNVSGRWRLIGWGAIE